MAGEAFFMASVAVSFLAGIVALAMPCCFSVLLPSYFASCFKRRTAMFGMTLVFTLGVAAILLPIALGISALSAYISLNHSLLFVVGGFFMVFLGIASLLGIRLMPMVNPNVDLKGTSVPTVFTLGAFSGIASSCCAPVLAGILVLTALTSSIVGAAAVGVAYVVGMVFPLFIGATLMDRSESIQKFLQGRMVNTRFGTVHSSRLISSIIFLSMGVATVLLGLVNRMLPTPGSELFNVYEAPIQSTVEEALASPLFQALVLGVTILVVVYVARWRVKHSNASLQTRETERRTQSSAENTNPSSTGQAASRS